MGGVLDVFAPDPLASLFKVPHHGAPNAHHEEVWTQLLAQQVVSVLAPFRAGVTPRPQPGGDIQRLKDRSSEVYSSANPKLPAADKAMRRTRASLAGFGDNVRAEGVSGQVRARKPAAAHETWEVSVFPPAMQL